MKTAIFKSPKCFEVEKQANILKSDFRVIEHKLKLENGIFTATITFEDENNENI